MPVSNTSTSPATFWADDGTAGIVDRNSPDTPETPSAPARQVTIVNRRGLHARASAAFARAAGAFRAEITVAKDDMSVPATSIMGLMMLGAARGDSIRLEATGDDAEAALVALESLVADRFGESE